MADSDAAGDLCECGVVMQRTFTMPRVVVKGSVPSVSELSRRANGLKQGEQVWINPRTQEKVRLTGTKADKKDAILRSAMAAGYDVSSSKDIEIAS